MIEQKITKNKYFSINSLKGNKLFLINYLINYTTTNTKKNLNGYFSNSTCLFLTIISKRLTLVENFSSFFSFFVCKQLRQPVPCILISPIDALRYQSRIDLIHNLMHFNNVPCHTYIFFEIPLEYTKMSLNFFHEKKLFRPNLWNLWRSFRETQFFISPSTHLQFNLPRSNNYPSFENFENVLDT